MIISLTQYGSNIIWFLKEPINEETMFILLTTEKNEAFVFNSQNEIEIQKHLIKAIRKNRINNIEII